MHIPMSRAEIATFLEQSPRKVEEAWTTNKLKRTVYHEGRLTAALAQSSIFDVLEYALAHQVLPVTLSREQAALWVMCLCEACEWEEWASWSTAERASQLLAFAMAEGLEPDDREKAAKVAMTMVITQGALLVTCLRNDALEGHVAA